MPPATMPATSSPWKTSPRLLGTRCCWLPSCATASDFRQPRRFPNCRRVVANRSSICRRACGNSRRPIRPIPSATAPGWKNCWLTSANASPACLLPEDLPTLVSRKIIFWEVDTQADFMKPDGKLYVRGAEKLVPNVQRLTDAARQGRVFLVSDACVHLPNDEEFKRWPPHCLRGTPGAEILPEGLARTFFTIPNRPGVKIPPDLSKVQQVILEKQTL